MKSRFTGKDPAAGKGCRQEENGAGDEMVGCHHWLSGHEFEQTPGVSEGQGSLACCSPQDHKESDMTEQHTSVTSHKGRLFWVMVRTCGNFQVYNTVLLSTLTMWYLRSPELAHLVTESL